MDKELESLMEEVFQEIGDSMQIVRDSAKVFLGLASECLDKKVYDQLPELVQKIAPTAIDHLDKIYRPADEQLYRTVKSEDDIDTKLKHSYDAICGGIRDGIGGLYNFFTLCKEKYDELPKSVQKMVDIAKDARKEFDKANNEISKSLEKLPSDKLAEYYEHHMNS
jgi:hypothetical protein